MTRVSPGRVVLLLLLILSLSPLAAPSSWAATSLPVPKTPTVTPEVGAIKVSWVKVRGVALYAVASTPTGLACTTSTTSCTFTGLLTSTKWTFSLREEIRGTWTKRSKWTHALTIIHVVVVAGQSNALGAQSYVVEPHSHVSIFGKDLGQSSDLTTQFFFDEPDYPDQIMVNPSNMHPITAPGDMETPQTLTASASPLGTPTKIFGPEVGLSRQLASDDVTHVAILKVAIGDTSLGGASTWLPASQGGSGSGGGYYYLLQDVSNLMSYEVSRGDFPVIEGFIWYQGENDALDLSYAKNYSTNLAEFLGDVRAALPMSLDAPIVLAEESISAYIAELEVEASPGSCSSCAALTEGDALVRAADEAAAQNLPSVTTVDTEALARVTPPGIHLSNSAELALGTELATALMTAGLP
jgi:hypothetical protein